MVLVPSILLFLPIPSVTLLLPADIRLGEDPTSKDLTVFSIEINSIAI